MKTESENNQTNVASGNAPKYGKYRGRVESDEHDPKMRGRVKVSVINEIPASDPQWAEACVPYAGDETGMLFLPKQGDNVWVEFEGGDTSKPIWVGCFWNENKAPGRDPKKKILKTPSSTLIMYEAKGGPEVTLETNGGAKLTVFATKVILESGEGGTVVIDRKKVSINDTALEVI